MIDIEWQQRVAAAMNEHVALEAHDLDTVLVDATRRDRHDPLSRPALGLAFAQSLTQKPTSLIISSHGRFRIRQRPVRLGGRNWS